MYRRRGRSGSQTDPLPTCQRRGQRTLLTTFLTAYLDGGTAVRDQSRGTRSTLHRFGQSRVVEGGGTRIPFPANRDRSMRKAS